MNNLDTYYTERKKHHLQVLKEKLVDYQKTEGADMSKEDQVSNFQNEVVYRYFHNGLLETRTQPDPSSNGIDVSTNEFLKDLRYAFQNNIGKYERNPIKNFLRREGEQTREVHLNKYKTHESNYSHKTHLLLDDEPKQLIDWLAELTVYNDFPENFPELSFYYESKKEKDEIYFEEEVDRKKKRIKYTSLTRVETSLLIQCLRDENFILSEKYINNINLGKAAYYMTGFSDESIRKGLSKPFKSYTKKQKINLSKKLHRIIDLLNS